MNAEVRINAVVNSKWRADDETFRPTYTINNDFHWVTDLQGYTATSVDAGTTLSDFVASEIALGKEVCVHLNVWLDNVTHPTVAAGVIRLPKGAHDVTWTQADLLDPHLTIHEAVANLILNLKNNAKY